MIIAIIGGLLLLAGIVMGILGGLWTYQTVNATSGSTTITATEWGLMIGGGVSFLIGTGLLIYSFMKG